MNVTFRPIVVWPGQPTPDRNRQSSPFSAAIAEQYLAGTNSTFKIGSAPNQSSLAVMDGQWTYEAMVEEMSNSTSAGHYEDVATLKKLTFNARLAYKADNLPQITVGLLYAIEINTPSGPNVVCNARISQMTGTQLNPRGGLTFGISGTSQGAVTITGMG